MSSLSSVLLTPQRFYHRLPCQRGYQDALRFAQLNYVAIGLGAGLWIFRLFVMRANNSGTERILIFVLPAFLMLLAPLCGIVVQRLIAALTLTPWMARGLLFDGRWAAKAMRYETAFLWFFCAFNGLFFSSFFWIGPRWIADLQLRILGHRSWIMAMPQEQLFFLIGNAVLSIWWLLRYRTILRSIRWCNH